jgi:hypothetical protein
METNNYENDNKGGYSTSDDNSKKVPAEQFGGSRSGWQADEVAREASQQDEDEIQRQINRGDETKGDPDARDIAGSADSNETPQGREEAKNDIQGKANSNG